MVLQSALPKRWTLDRVGEIEPSTELLDPADHFVGTGLRPAAGNSEVLHCLARLAFELCPCLVRASESPVEWWIGRLDTDDLSIACWADYGSDLGEASHPRALRHQRQVSAFSVRGVAWGSRRQHAPSWFYSFWS
jgi:hypothetical protein